MIYSRKTDFVKILPDDLEYVPYFYNKQAECSPNQKKADITAMTDKRTSRREKKRKASKGARMIIAVMFIFCAVVFDSRVLGGRLSEPLKNAARAAVSNENAKQSEHGGVTLYKRLDTVKNTVDEDIKNPSALSMYKEGGEDTGEEQALTVGEKTSFAMVDGHVYYPISAVDLSSPDLYTLSNETAYKPDVKALSDVKAAALEGVEITSEPLVLIVHTHGAESYTQSTDMYPGGEATRNYDIEKNVVRVGREISETLQDFGISSVHCEIMHDEKSFINAYSESGKTVARYLERYPSIKFVIDVHRDAIIRDDGEGIKAIKNIGGEDYAQLMFVVGTDEKGHAHPNWQQNLSLAVELQESIETLYPGLCRSINLRDVPFNQWYSNGYLLLEVGTCSNTLEEALRSARAFGQGLARTINLN